MDPIYNKLQEQLDQYSVGYPKTESGIEMKILQRLFSIEHARMYLDLTMLLEEPESVAKRNNRDIGETAIMLEDMAKKGLIFRLRRGDSVKYGAVPFVVGSYEFQLKYMDKELAEMVEEYFAEGFLSIDNHKTLPMRTIPVNQAVDSSFSVSPHDDARKIIKDQKKLAVANCICRTQKAQIDEPCDKPLEVCFVFGSHADYFVENELARYIDEKEALELLDKAEAAGLVNQPFNVINPGGMCNCCGCCCGVLRALKRHPRPREAVVSTCYATVNQDFCTGCGTCIDRCQMDAVTITDDGVAKVEEMRCIGCGLCKTTCPVDAISLISLEGENKKTPPGGIQELMMQIATERGTSLMPLKMAEKE